MYFQDSNCKQPYNTALLDGAQLILQLFTIHTIFWIENLSMPSNITKEELETLKDFNGRLPNWDSDLEAEDFEPPDKVKAYIEARDQLRAEREAAIKETRKKVGVYNKDKWERRQKKLEAERKKKKKLYERYLDEKNTRDSKEPTDTPSSSCSKPVSKKPKTDSTKAKTKPSVHVNSLKGYLVNGRVVKGTDSFAEVSTVAASVPGSFVTPLASSGRSTAETVDTMVSYASKDGTQLVPSIDRLTSRIQSPTVDMSQGCRACHRPFHRCFEYLFRDSCLHSVLDYFEDVGYDMVTASGIRKKYYSTFLLLMKQDVVSDTFFWELDEHIQVPECMRTGSLNQAVELMTFNEHFDYLMSKRVFNVENHIKTHINGEWALPKEGERLVDESGKLEEPKRIM